MQSRRQPKITDCLHKQYACSVYVLYIYIINKLLLFSVRALIKYMFWIIRVSQLPVQPLPTITSDNGE
jgi:hypothetical protein